MKWNKLVERWYEQSSVYFNTFNLLYQMASYEEMYNTTSEDETEWQTMNYTVDSGQKWGRGREGDLHNEDLTSAHKQHPGNWRWNSIKMF